MSFFGFGKKKAKEDENAARAELFKKNTTPVQPAVPAAAPPPPRGASVSSSSTTLNTPQTGLTVPPPIPRTYASEKEHYDALVAERRGLDQASLESTRRSVNRIAEAEMLASGNLSKLSTQGEQLARTERRLDDAAGHAKVSEVRTNDLQKLQAAFFIPVHTSSDKPGFMVTTPSASRSEQEQWNADYRRKGTVNTMTGHYQGADNSAAKLQSGVASRANPYELDDRAVNKEIDDNLSAISGSVARLKAMSLVMNDEIESQNQRIERMGVKAEAVKGSVDTSKVKLEKIMGKKVDG